MDISDALSRRLPRTGVEGHMPPMTSSPGADRSGADRQGAADPVIVRRRQMARGAEVAQRAGYALFALAIVLFMIGFAVGLTGGLVTAILVAMGVGSALLAPAIVVGYAVKAATATIGARLRRRPVT